MKKFLLIYFLLLASAFPQGSRPPVTTLSGLTDVSITSPSTGQPLIYDSTVSKWKNGSVSVPALADLSDVAIVSMAGSQVLRWDDTSSKWVNYGPMAFTDITGSITPSQMNGGLGAADNTYWKGNGTWGSIASAGTVTPTTNFLMGDGSGNAVDTVSGSPTVAMALTGMSSTTSSLNGDYLVNWANNGTGANATTGFRMVVADGYTEIKTLGSTFTAVGILTPDDLWIRQHMAPSGPKAGNLVFTTAGDQMRYSNDDGLTLRMLVGNGLSVGSSTDPGVGLINAQTGFRVANAATSGKILKANGTNFVASTETYAAPGANGNIMKSDGTNWTSAAPTSGGTVTSISASSPISVSPNPIVATGTVSLLTNVDLAMTATQSIVNSTLVTNAVTNTLTLAENSTGVAANGFGTGIKFQAESSTTNSQDQAYIQSAWSDATHASRTAYLDFQTANNPGTVASRMRLFGSGGLSVGSTTDPGSGIVNANTGYWVAGASSTTGKILKSDGSKFTASTETYAVPGTAGKLMQSDGTNWTASSMVWPTVAPASGKMLISTGTAIAASTPTYPTTAGTSGNTMKSDGTNWTSAAPPAYASLQTAQLNPTGTSSTSGVMMGMGSTATITPTVTGKVLITVSGTLTSGSGTSSMSVRWGTGTAPINTAAPTGTVVGGAINQSASTASGFSLGGLKTGLAIGTAVWIDAVLVVGSGTAANISSVSVTAVELP